METHRLKSVLQNRNAKAHLVLHSRELGMAAQWRTLQLAAFWASTKFKSTQKQKAHKNSKPHKLKHAPLSGQHESCDGVAVLQHRLQSVGFHQVKEGLVYRATAISLGFLVELHRLKPVLLKPVLLKFAFKTIRREFSTARWSRTPLAV